MKIALVCPRGITHYSSEELKEPHGILFLAAMLRRAGYQVHLADMMFLPTPTDDSLPQAVLDTIDGAEVVGLSLSGAVQIEWAKRVVAATLAGRTHSFLVAGGILATFATEQLLREIPELDCVIRGEGEESLLALVRCLEQGTDWRSVPGVCFLRGDEMVVRPLAPLIRDLNALPFIARDYLQHSIMVGNRASILTSRGCWGRCVFCITHLATRLGSGKVWRYRSGENVIRELDSLWHNYHINRIHFAEDTFIGPGYEGRERVLAIADAMISSGRDYRFFVQMRVDVVDDTIIHRLVEAGLDDLGIGIESWSQTQLARFSKLTSIEQNYRAMDIISRYNIRKVRIGCLMFDAHSTLEELRIQIAEMSRFDQFELLRCKNRVRVYPGNPEVDKLRSAALLRGDWHNYSYDFADERVGWAYPLIFSIFTELGNLETEATRLQNSHSQVKEAAKEFRNDLRRKSFAFFTEILERADRIRGANEAVRESMRQSVLEDHDALKQSSLQTLALLSIMAKTDDMAIATAGETGGPVHAG